MFPILSFKSFEKEIHGCITHNCGGDAGTELFYNVEGLLTDEALSYINLHGTGIIQSLHLYIGSPHCSAFPKGEFTPVRGFANMIRKMGASYDRIDIAASDSLDSGAKVPVQELLSKLQLMLCSNNINMSI